MATRKQRKRSQKERRHEYETVWVDSEGNDLEEPPDDAPVPARERRPDGKKTQQKRSASGRADRVPLPPSWRRSAKRAGLLGLAVVVFFYIATSKQSGGTRVAIALVWGVGYTVLFIPFTYLLDRFIYMRWQRKMGQLPTKR